MGLRPSASSLDGVDVVDMGTGFSGALAARLLADLGASVTRVRESGEDDPFAASSAAYRLWRAQQPTVECRTAGEADERLAAADVLLTGGDDHPALPDRDGTAEAAAARHPRLVVLSISGTAAGSDRGALPGNDLLAQARSGLASEQFSDRPIAFGLRLPTYGAVLHGLIGLISALLARDSTGQGDIVRTSFVQGAAGWLTPVWIRAEAPHPAMTGIIPKDVVWPIYQCADGAWITYAQGTAGSTQRIHEVLGLDAPEGSASERFRHSVATSPERYFGVTPELAQRISTWDSSELRDALVSVDVATEIVRAPGECWDDPQVTANGMIVEDSSGRERAGLPIQVETGESR